MANYYVDNASTGDNDGTTWAHAWQSFAAIPWSTGIAAGDNVYISGGGSSTSQTYTEDFTIGQSGTTGNRLTIKPGQTTDHGGKVIFTGQVFITGQSHITLSGDNGASTSPRLSLQHQTTVFGDAEPMITNSGSAFSLVFEYIEITNCRWTSATSAGGGMIDWASTMPSSDDSEIRYCEIHDQVNEAGYNIWIRPATTVDDEYGLIKIHHNKIYNFYGDAIQLSAQGVDVYNNEIHHCYTSLEHPDGVQGGAAGYIRIYNNDFYGWLSTTGEARGNSYIRWNPSSTAVGHFWVYNNLFRETYATPVAGHRGIELSHNVANFPKEITDVYVFNNTFYRVGDLGSYYFGSDTDVTSIANYHVVNNIFYDMSGVSISAPVGGPQTKGSWGDGANVTMDHNLFYASSTDYQTNISWKGATIAAGSSWNASSGNPGDNDIVGDPGLSTDLTVSASSSAVVGAGVNPSTWGITLDKAGVTRGVAWDIGAYEYAAGAASTETPISGAPIMMW